MRSQHGTGGPSTHGGGQKTEAARVAADEIASTAMGQARSFVGEARSETEHVVGDVRDRLQEEAENQTRKATENLRQWSRDLESMAEHAETDSPVGDVVRQVAGGGRGTADFLDQRGLDGLLDEARDLARRRPVAFLVGAAVAGFALGRVLKVSPSASGQGSPQGPERGSPQVQSHESASLPRQGRASAGETIPPDLASQRLGRRPEGEGG